VVVHEVPSQRLEGLQNFASGKRLVVCVSLGWDENVHLAVDDISDPRDAFDP